MTSYRSVWVPGQRLVNSFAAATPNTSGPARYGRDEHSATGRDGVSSTFTKRPFIVLIAELGDDVLSDETTIPRFRLRTTDGSDRRHVRVAAPTRALEAERAGRPRGELALTDMVGGTARSGTAGATAVRD